jgi:TatD DNase family protein
MLVDIHTHHFPPANQFTICNIEVEKIKNVLKNYSEKYFSTGIHPWKIDETLTEKIRELEQIVDNKYVIAIGECGLDKNVNVLQKVQIQVFEQHISLSEKHRKALIIHCTGRFNELIQLKKTLNPSQKWIIHGFRGKPQLADQLLNTGFSLSFGKNFNTESVKTTPIENLFVETDESNASIKEIYDNISAVKCCNPNDLTAGKFWLQKIINK